MPCFEADDLVAVLEPHAGPQPGATASQCGSSSGCAATRPSARSASCSKRGNSYSYAKAAGALVLVCADEGEDERTARYAAVDTGAAIAQLTIEAVSRGLIAHPMAGFNADGAREAFGIPDGVQPIAVVAVGALGDYDNAPPEIVERDAKGRPPHAPRRSGVRGQLGAAAALMGHVMNRP
jgi:nitroreductase